MSRIGGEHQYQEWQMFYIEAYGLTLLIAQEKIGIHKINETTRRSFIAQKR